MKTLSKYEIADRAGVSWRVFRSWIKKDIDHLNALGYNPDSSLLNPAIIKFLSEKYCIDL